MPDNTMDDAPETAREPASESGPPKGTRRYPVLLGILVISIAAGAWVYKTRPDLVTRVLPVLNSKLSLGRPSQALSDSSSQNLLSSGEVLNSVGKSPAQLVKGLFPTLDGSAGPEAAVSTEACPPNPLAAPAEESETGDRPSDGRTEARGEGSISPRMIETPVIVPRAPSNEPAPHPTGTSHGETASAAAVATGDAVSEPKSPNDHKRRPAVERPGDRKKTSKKQLASVQPASHREGEEASQKPGAKRHLGEGQEARGERFELPGSLMVAIKDYQGTAVKWGLMVVLDDSLVMGKKTKTWNPTRGAVAASLVSKLPSALTPGSRLAVRDFLCPQKTERRKCLSHLLFDWDGAPYKNLEEKLKKVEPAGRTDPCAAAAYAVKKDLAGLGQITPRVLIVTGGRAKCDTREVLQALAQHKSKDKVVVDVVGIGMLRKTVRGYSAMAKRSQGAFLKADNPGELEQVLSRYKKILSKRAMEKIEIRGEKAVFTVNPGEEITLAPGAYSVVLPLVASLKAAKRIIGDIKIRSGESTVVHVRIRKGRPIVKTAKK